MSFDFINLNEDNINPQTLTKRTRASLSDLANGKPYHIDHFGFDTGKFGEYAYFFVSEEPSKTYYASKPITRKLRQISDARAADELHKQPVIFAKHTVEIAGNSIEYIDVTFIQIANN